MASELSRAELIERLKNMAEDGIVDEAIIAHDAVLREQLAEAERQRDAHADIASERRRETDGLRQRVQELDQARQREEVGQLRHRVQELEQELRERAKDCAEHSQDHARAQLAANDARKQLAALTAKLATAENTICTAQDQIPPDMDGDSLSVALIKLKDMRHDITAKLAAVEGKLQCGHSAQWYAVDDEANDDCLGCRTIHLQQQLAAAQAKIIALTDALEAGFMKGAYARLSELQHKEQKLYEAEARIRDLEQALRLHLAVAKDDPILLTPIEQQ